MITPRLVPWKVWVVWSVLALGLAALLLVGSLALVRRVTAQATPAPCDEVLLTMHRQLADQVQHQLLTELAAARRELARRPAAIAPAPTAPAPVVP